MVALSRKERARFENMLLILYGMWHTFDQWNRVLVPFNQWSIEPRPSMHDMLVLNSVTSTILLIGAVASAELIEACGLRHSAVIMTLVTSMYQILVPSMRIYWQFALWQLMQCFNHMPMIVDTAVFYLEGEDGDEKRRAQMFTKFTLPTSIGFVMGPFVALQVLYFIDTDLGFSQTLCGALLLLLVAPFAYYLLPEGHIGKFRMPKCDDYKRLFLNERSRWCLLLLLMVAGPYNAYDMITRMSLSSSVINNPNKMTQLFIVLGGTSVLVSMLILPQAQRHYTPKQVLMGSLVLLCASYLYLSQMSTYTNLFFGMPFQMAGVSISVGELTSQILGSVDRREAGKTLALIRMCNLVATALTPFITGLYMESATTSVLCYVSAAISFLAIPIVYKYCDFMNLRTILLPLDGIPKYD